MNEQDPLIGQQIDNYKIERLLGQGGMAVVYLAQDLVLKRSVVLKMMLPDLARHEEIRLRFEREAQATAQLQHPNIIPIYTIGTAPNGRPYLALQYIEGGSLSDYLEEMTRQGRWISTIYALSLVHQMAAALATAHKANIIHRDLKPSNILLRQDGTPVISDLGIAAVQQATLRLTHTGAIIGTPNYMSPEQASSHFIDGRSDLYSLGIILYELLSGRLPFHATSPVAMLHNHIYEQPTPLQHIRPDLTAATYAVVATCLQKKPIDRYPNAQALVTALEQAIAAENANPKMSLAAWQPTVSESETGLKKTTGPPKAKRPLWLYALVLIGLLFAGSLALLAWRQNSPLVIANDPTASGTTASGTTASGTTASGTTASGTTASGTTASGTTASGTTASGTTASGTTASGTTASATATATLATTPTNTPQPMLIAPQSIRASDYDHSGSQDADSNPTNFLPENAIDRVQTTAWRIPGSGANEWLEISFNKPVIIGRVGLVPGYAKIDPLDNTNRFTQNYVVQRVRYEFSDGSEYTDSFTYEPEMQYIEINQVVTTYLRIVIIDTYEPQGNDIREFTPISEVEIWGWIE